MCQGARLARMENSKKIRPLNDSPIFIMTLQSLNWEQVVALYWQYGMLRLDSLTV